MKRSELQQLDKILSEVREFQQRKTALELRLVPLEQTLDPRRLQVLEQMAAGPAREDFAVAASELRLTISAGASSAVAPAILDALRAIGQVSGVEQADRLKFELTLP